MKTFLLPVLAIATAMGNAMAKHHEGMMSGEPQDFLMGSMMGMMQYIRETKHCIDISPIAGEIYGLICDTEGCAENGRRCMNAFMPQELLCKHMKACVLGDDGVQTFSPRNNPMAMMQHCMMGGLMEEMDIEYVEGNNKENMINVIGGMLDLAKTLPEVEELPDSTSNYLLMSIQNDDCVAPGEDFNIMDMMRFKSCLMKKCVRSLGAQ